MIVPRHLGVLHKRPTRDPRWDRKMTDSSLPEHPEKAHLLTEFPGALEFRCTPRDGSQESDHSGLNILSYLQFSFSLAVLGACGHLSKGERGSMRRLTFQKDQLDIRLVGNNGYCVVSALHRFYMCGWKIFRKYRHLHSPYTEHLLAIP